MARRKIDRRSLMKSAAMTAFLLPIVRATMADAATAPLRRFLVLWHPNGLNYPDAGPSGSQTAWSFGDYFSGLERHRADTIALSGMQIGGVPYGKNTEIGHKSGGMGCLTCTPDEGTGFATGPSVDQFIAQKINDQGLAPMRQAPVFGVGNSKQSPFCHVFHEAAGKPAIVENSPKIAYDSLFANVAASTGQDTSKILARKKSILDAALADCNQHLAALPADGKALLDYHCTSIRQMETNLQSSAVVCAPPKAGYDKNSALDAGNPSNYEALTDFFFQMIQVAYLCDLTRVQSFSFGSDAARLNMPWLNPPVLATVDTGEKNVRDHHSHTHAGTRETVGMFMSWYTGKYAQFLDTLKQKLPDGSSLFDSTVVYWTTEYGGAGHSNKDVAGFVFGNGGGTFKTNRHLHYDNDAKHSHALMVSLIKYMGITGVDQFGHPGGGTGTLAELYG